METRKRSSLSVLFYIKRQKLLKNGEAPICMRITVNKRCVEIMVKRSIPIEQWNQTKECSKGKGRTGMELNHYLNSLRARIIQIHGELEMREQEVTAGIIRDRFYGKEAVRKMLLKIYQEHNDKCRSLIGGEYSQSTVEKFDTSLRCLHEFILSYYKKEDIAVEDVNGEFIRNFEFWLKAERKLQNNSALKHLKNLKKIIRIALGNNWIRHDPFYGIHFRREEVQVEFLSREELEVLMKKELSIPRLEQIRDVFSFCCLTGLAFIDVKQLSHEHLIKDNNGALWIRKARQKTKQMCNIPLLKPALKLIKKYENNPYCIKNDVLLPVISNQKMNAYLKELADICHIHKRLTTHVARHTAASVVFLANEVSIENVAKILGHSNIRMTQHYAKVLDKSIMRDMANVEKDFAV